MPVIYRNCNLTDSHKFKIICKNMTTCKNCPLFYLLQNNSEKRKIMFNFLLAVTKTKRV